MTTPQADTAKLELDEGTPGRPRPSSPCVQVDLAGVSDRGKVRSNNEDHFLIARFGRYLEAVATNLPVGEVAQRTQETGYGLLVADGMGGHAAGEVASKTAIRTLVNLVLETPDWILRLDDPRLVAEVGRRARERWRQIHAALTHLGQADPDLRGLGTTLTLAVSLANDLIISHVGDSRAYLYRQGRLQRLTRDHTMARSLADQGLIAEEAVATHRLRHMLTEVLGSEGRAPQPDVEMIKLQNADSLLLCTDGLTEMVGEEAIAATLAAEDPAAVACRRLLDQALDAGGKDNVTVVLARYHFPG